MTWHVIRALVVKDLKLFMRNRFFAFISGLGVLAYAGIYLVMPRSVDETLEIALYAPNIPAFFQEQLQGEGLLFQPVASEDALKAAVIEGDFGVGMALPADFVERLVAGRKARVDVYFASDVPQELRGTYTVLLDELAFAIGGEPLRIEVEEQILGPDLAGRQIPPRDRMLPLFAVFLLMVESMGLASLITAEVEEGTLRALLVTPLRIEGLFLGKGIMGVGLAFVQASLLMLLTGGFSRQPLLILTGLLLGSILVTGIGFLIASVGRDMLSVMGYGMVALVLLSVPTFGVLFPGSVSGWVEIIPSYYLVDVVHQVVNFEAGWGDVWQNLAILLVWAVGLLLLGTVILRRRFERPYVVAL